MTTVRACTNAQQDRAACTGHQAVLLLHTIDFIGLKKAGMALETGPTQHLHSAREEQLQCIDNPSPLYKGTKTSLFETSQIGV